MVERNERGGSSQITRTASISDERLTSYGFELVSIS